MKNNILFISWPCINKNGYIKCLQDMGLNIVLFEINDLKKLRHDPDLHSEIAKYIRNNNCIATFVINNCEQVALACEETGTQYISWSYDSPVNMRDGSGICNDKSNIFLFDSLEADYWNRIEGYNNIFYLPLGVDTAHYDDLLGGLGNRQYTSEVSFVGSLYDSKFIDIVNKLSDYKKGFVNAIIDYSLNNNDENYLDNVINGAFLEWLDNKEINSLLDADYEMYLGDYDALASEFRKQANRYITSKERLLILSLLSNHLKVDLYSGSTSNILKKVNTKGTVDYDTEMPKVFRNSKINLNITYRSIRAGIPLRCLDIMACKGFLLSNEQKDFGEHFKDGYNIAFFHSPQEALDKCLYYLEHDTAREEIAYRGYETVKKYYSLTEQFKHIFEISGLGYLLID